MFLSVVVFICSTCDVRSIYASSFMFRGFRVGTICRLSSLPASPVHGVGTMSSVFSLSFAPPPSVYARVDGHKQCEHYMWWSPTRLFAAQWVRGMQLGRLFQSLAGLSVSECVLLTASVGYTRLVAILPARVTRLSFRVYGTRGEKRTPPNVRL